MTPRNAIVPAGSQPLAAPVTLPPELQKFWRPEGYYNDIGELEAQDLSLNQFKIVHGMSKWAKPNWDGRNSPAIPVSSYILANTGTVVPLGNPVVFLMRTCRYIEWADKPGLSQIINSSDTRTADWIVKSRGLNWTKLNDGESVPPRVTKYVNFLIVTRESPDEPLLLGFKRTSLKFARDITAQLIRATEQWHLPMFLFKFKLLEPKWENNAKGSWPQINIAFDGYVPTASLPRLEQAYQKAKELLALLSIAQQLGEDNEDSGEADPGKQPMFNAQNAANLKSAAIPDVMPDDLPDSKVNDLFIPHNQQQVFTAPSAPGVIAGESPIPPTGIPATTTIRTLPSAPATVAQAPQPEAPKPAAVAPGNVEKLW